MFEDAAVDAAKNYQGKSDTASTTSDDGVKMQAKRPISVPGTTKTLSQTFVDNTINSFGIYDLGNFEQVQERVYNTLLKEGFFTDTDPISRKDTNDESGMVVETNKSGLDETFCRENYGVLGRFKKIVKLATIRELPKAIKHGRLLDDDVPNKYDKTKGTKYAYLLYDTHLDGVDVTLKITIRKSAQKNKFWVHGLETIEKVSDPPADTIDGIKTGSTTADIGGIITQPKPIVKNQMKKDSQGNKLSEEQIEFFKDSKVRDSDGNLLVMYHGTPNAGFTKFKSGTYFTEHKWYADRYQSPGASSLSYKKTADSPDTYSVYKNATPTF